MEIGLRSQLFSSDVRIFGGKFMENTKDIVWRGSEVGPELGKGTVQARDGKGFGADSPSSNMNTSKLLVISGPDGKRFREIHGSQSVRFESSGLRKGTSIVNLRLHIGPGW